MTLLGANTVIYSTFIGPMDKDYSLEVKLPGDTYHTPHHLWKANLTDILAPGNLYDL